MVASPRGGRSALETAMCPAGGRLGRRRASRAAGRPVGAALAGRLLLAAALLALLGSVAAGAGAGVGSLANALDAVGVGSRAGGREAVGRDAPASRLSPALFLPVTASPRPECAPPEAIPLDALALRNETLSDEERDLLPFLCWPREGLALDLERGEWVETGGGGRAGKARGRERGGDGGSVVGPSRAGGRGSSGAGEGGADEGLPSLGDGSAVEGPFGSGDGGSVANPSGPGEGGVVGGPFGVSFRPSLSSAPRPGVPPDARCTPIQWCDEVACTEVCDRGSLAVPGWLRRALRAQRALSADVPLCWDTLPGTHNSGISLADGYGNRDEYFRGYFRFVKWALPSFKHAPMRTNDQLLSLTDQMSLGVRSVELDTHWVAGRLRVAHCGGLHVPQLNALVKALNLVLKLLGRSVRWDTETMGCSPSLSSIAVREQRTFADALGEIRAYIDAAPGFRDEQAASEREGGTGGPAEAVSGNRPSEEKGATGGPAAAPLELGTRKPAGNEAPAGKAAPSPPAPTFPEHDFLIIYLDDQSDLATWGVLPQLTKEILDAFPADWLYTASEVAEDTAARGGQWPSRRELRARGRKLAVISSKDYGQAAMGEYVIAKGPDTCAWWEPQAAKVSGAPACASDDGTWRHRLKPLGNGSWSRVFSCELLYGPFDCEFRWNGINAVLDERNIPEILPCDAGQIAPDLLTPTRAEGWVWAWAPGHPVQDQSGSGGGANRAQSGRGKGGEFAGRGGGEGGELTGRGGGEGGELTGRGRSETARPRRDGRRAAATERGATGPGARSDGSLRDVASDDERPRRSAPLARSAAPFDERLHEWRLRSEDRELLRGPFDWDGWDLEEERPGPTPPLSSSWVPGWARRAAARAAAAAKRAAAAARRAAGWDDARRAYVGETCAAAAAADGRWRSARCAADAPSACRVAADGSWALGRGGRGECPPGTSFDAPRHAGDNAALQEALRDAGAPAAWLPLGGPRWTLAHLPSFSFQPPPRLARGRVQDV